MGRMGSDVKVCFLDDSCVAGREAEQSRWWYRWSLQHDQFSGLLSIFLPHIGMLPIRGPPKIYF